MTPAEYVNEIVQPTVREFRDERRSRRRAYLACIVVFHIIDYLKNAGEKDVWRKLKQANPDIFELVRSICDGSKHFETNAKHAVHFRAGSDWDRPPAFPGSCEQAFPSWETQKADDQRKSAMVRWTFTAV